MEEKKETKPTQPSHRATHEIIVTIRSLPPSLPSLFCHGKGRLFNSYLYFIREEKVADLSWKIAQDYFIILIPGWDGMLFIFKQFSSANFLTCHGFRHIRRGRDWIKVSKVSLWYDGGARWTF